MRLGHLLPFSVVLLCLSSAHTVLGAQDLEKPQAKAHGAKGGHAKRIDGKNGEKHPPAPAAEQKKDNPIFPTSPESWDLFLFTLALFLALVFLLRPAVWNPILAGLRRREESIRTAEQEARLARNEAEQARIEFESQRKAAYAEIPKLMETARKEAEKHRDEIRSDGMAKIQQERENLRRQVETAKSRLLDEVRQQAPALSALISAKTIGREVSADEHRRFADEALGELSAKER